jgi:hypothetical protein
MGLGQGGFKCGMKLEWRFPFDCKGSDAALPKWFVAKYSECDVSLNLSRITLQLVTKDFEATAAS